MAILNNSNAISSGGYDINNSLRIRSSATANLTRTPATTTNRRTYTWSSWVKRGALPSSRMVLFIGDDGTVYTYIGFNSSHELQFYHVPNTSGTEYNYKTSAVFRDPSAWYHVVLAVDTTQATAGNRVKIYVNGVQQTLTLTTAYGDIPQNTDTFINTSNGHTSYGWNRGSSPFDGYGTEVNFVDGSQLTPSSFGETDTTTGVWKPKAYTGTYGTNGFYLKFSDIATTSGSNAGLGKDFSGNANYWTTNNISVTAGTTYDAMTDSPTLTSTTVANYAVMNPIMAGSITVTDGNLSVQKVGASYGNTNSTIAFPTSGKYYFEVTIVSGTSGNNQQMGMGTQGGSYYFVLDCYYSGSLIRKVADGVATTGYGTASVGTIIGVAVDADNGKAYLAINNTWIDSSSPTGGTGGYSMTAGQVYSGFFQAYNSGVSAYNFGQRPFSYTPPTGFVRLNTFNLPTPTILQGNKYMDATLYTGTRTTQVVVNSGQFKPDMVWCKSRSFAAETLVSDSVRGTTKQLFTSRTDAEQTDSTMITSLNSNGFTLGDNSGGPVGNINYNIGATYVGWQWQAGQGSTSSNTSGSITSTVSVNATAGFSIVTYTGNLSSAGTATVGHGLGVAPKMIITKARNGTSDWSVMHTSLTNWNYQLFLNATSATYDSTANGSRSAPTSTVFTTNWTTGVNTNGATIVAYCWAEIAGFSKFGSYTGNGSTDGNFVYLGFRPKYILFKNTSIAEGWNVRDTSRDTYNASQYELYPNSSAAEGNASGRSPTTYLDILSNGFKLRSNNAELNNSTGTNVYIYAAFAENPFKNSLAR